MSRIHGTNTKPELEVRKQLYSMGYRYRLHYAKLPGRPDIALPKHKKAIFVHGCFWHGHEDCARSRTPETNREFWEEKIRKTMQRDAQNMGDLSALGWKALVIWQCEIRDTVGLGQKLLEFLLET
jgi:DNA mismatch endonuclease, patch repair protein